MFLEMQKRGYSNVKGGQRMETKPIMKVDRVIVEMEAHEAEDIIYEVSKFKKGNKVLNNFCRLLSKTLYPDGPVVKRGRYKNPREYSVKGNCKFCDRPFKKQSYLDNHEKECPENPENKK
jgi:hypothetical protein